MLKRNNVGKEKGSRESDIIYICTKYHNKISFCIKINTDKITTIKHEKNSKSALY